ncbi:MULTISPECIES: FAD/NAD(P)-binding protein [Chryseobacterium]|uniref:FAD-dependent urate hydroxylase HpyO/Asp monooxygenase CreE-like FAD/NAD(P)-binding domain-containing protein n=1 Tax=Chryseobacterium camelliae TaxID=1265445 RepID=A0ABU0TG65_9FLAO|nr:MULTISPECIES: FAD/NAD(P)-binding protein [Chryseobacterium]MDT3406255.1 hypothetical protein [Pseudacidovorax intermedius]MDQ1095946.1 hypothetical protein [Chryseobacterium camelliae]MDQ1099882.1 hypothetical protein [Chryseobacterium sp. SORGH_AS_1048]MDR6087228.1 hypothetical protein [Chryseobacterium sp. SORGH_AS_0909]MDR6131602.1 hypothetical protein [Chryseobacterium sp. SORGH_AS_1175]
MKNKYSERIALIGGGPASLFVMKHIVEQDLKPETVCIFEKNDRLGAGMPYGKYGAGIEHVANVSANELPELAEDFTSYISRHPAAEFKDFYHSDGINEYQVIPRLLLGNYLEEQFSHYISKAKKLGIDVQVFTNSTVVDIIRVEKETCFKVVTENGDHHHTGNIIICTGHYWPKRNEEKVKGWYDSPYPPSKFTGPTNYPVAIKGTSLTAVDAVKTLARKNGYFDFQGDELQYFTHEGSENFSISLFSLGGYLPALRFHSEESAYSEGWIMSLDDIYEYKKSHNGFVDLDYVFEINFKQPLQKRDPDFYEKIKSLSIEEFVETMMEIRDKLDGFELFKAEYAEAEKSIRRHQSITWKEALSAFSYAVNYPAKHFSAEDMLRLRKTLMPLISIIIASLPQSSYRELIALYNAGKVRLIDVDEKSHVEPHPEEGGVYHFTDENGNEKKEYYRMYIDATGQKPIEFNQVPFEGLKDSGTISSGYLRFKSAEKGEESYEKDHSNIIKADQENYYLRVKGLNINDYFQALDYYGHPTPELFIMAVPYIGGLNPDYSGLDFCDTAGKVVVKALKNRLKEMA